jgi:AbrB family looped-hinge helix DNA binding protein
VVDRKGQITIPKNIRDKVALSLSDKVEFVFLKDGVLIVQPLTR